MEETESPPVKVDAPARLPIKTYHCRFCSHLLIASTRELLSSTAPLKRRAGPPGLDHALILRLPGLSTSRKNKNEEDIPDTETGAGTGAEKVAVHGGSHTDNKKQTSDSAEEAKREEAEQQQAHYTIPLSTLVPEPKPIVVRREDGFEKRVLLRCGRCRVVVGYEIGSSSSSATSLRNEDEDEDEDEDEVEIEDEEDEYIERKKKRRRDDKDRAIYLLPGSIVGTEDLVDVPEGDAVNGMVERNAVLKGMEREWMEWIK